MIRSFIFWIIVGPASIAFLLGLIASIAKSMAGRMKSDQSQEPSQ